MKKMFAGLFALGLGFALNAQAISIDLVPNHTSIQNGDAVEVQVRISGLQDNVAPALGVYDVNLNYDASLFSVSGITWGDPVKGNQLDLNGFGSLQESTTLANWLTIFEVSFDEAADLNTLQSGEFTLFSVIFNSIAIGNADFSLDINALGNAYGDNLLVDTINNTRVNISAVSVPEPSGLLLILGLASVVLLRMRMMQNQK